MKKICIDFETRSAVDLKAVGAWKYAADPSTEILCLAIAEEGKKPVIVSGKGLLPGEMGISFAPDVQIVAHNAQFEMAIWHHIMYKRFGHPPMDDPKRWNCTMARALQVGLPAGLDPIGRALNLSVQKDLDGRRIMLQMCKPVMVDVLGDPVYDNTPAKYERLFAYCAKDVETEILVDQALPELGLHERAVFELDLLINQRGVQVDVDLAVRCSKMAETLTRDLNAQLHELTKGAVDKATRVAAMKTFLAAHGVAVESLDKSAVTALLADPKVPPIVKAVISIRRQVGKSSTAKYAKTIDAANPQDGRIRGVLQYHAAHTGRWGGRLIQPQNYPQGFDEAEQAKAIDLIKTGNAEDFKLVYGDKSMDALSDTLRGTIIAGPDKILIAADFTAIEARVNFWLAGEESALNTYRQGGSPYLDMGAFIFKRPITKKNVREYKIAKMTILGAGFQMGPDRFFAQCLAAGVDLSLELAQVAIRSFREKYPRVKSMWYEMEKAAINAVKNPGTSYQVCGGKVLWCVSWDRRFLVARLPSGRYLWYYKPSTRTVTTEWGNEKEELCYWGEDSKTHTWTQLKTYGGALTENVTQAVARDLMVNGMHKVEAQGYPIVLTCHDEIVSEIPDAKIYTHMSHADHLEAFMKLMCDMPLWAKTCPVAAEGFVAKRYRK